ncbi:hypothetical protein JMJ77_0006447, partial [Colletotrichum scovillei]
LGQKKRKNIDRGNKAEKTTKIIPFTVSAFRAALSRRTVCSLGKTQVWLPRRPISNNIRLHLFTSPSIA